MTDQVAILDFGTARTKILIAFGGVDSFVGKSIETRWGNALKDTPLSPDQVAALLTEIETTARDMGATDFRCIGTEAFRSILALQPVREAIEDRFGRLQILTPFTEACLYFQSVGTIEKISNGIAVDIGGGSVQIVWGETEYDFCSLPIGTFFLEKTFQTQQGIFLSQEHADARAMRNCVKNELESYKDQFSHLMGRPLVIGSNVMRDFFDAVRIHVQLKSAMGHLSRADIDVLMTTWANVSYTNLGYIFPQNPYFLCGADKLLIIVGVLMDILEASDAIVTNASVSKGLALTSL